MAELYPGLHNDAVKKRHMRYARALVDEGFGFDMLVDEGRAGVEALVRNALDLPEFRLAAQASGLVARTADGTLAAVAIVSAVSYDNGTALFVRALATAEDFRSKGLATVLLGLLPQILPQAGLPTRALLTGACPETRASFLHRAGFVVLEPGDPSPYSFGGIEEDLLDTTDPADRCWFFRDVQ
ncbi:GNAT family N-acetyltransferase [Brevibacterium samyangense]|uniref:N-acetyltransferase domain-containing protein n=1 Tax=Brevibacterium samyangense TaxID=366888 RepID=A0ABP5EXQ5_9MICO